MHNEIKISQNFLPENPEISIIVPAYNCQNYIQKCLESLVNQTLKEIEIIIINDGSTDSTGTIIDDFAGIDGRIKVVNQTNQKQGAARNRGLEIAKGKYISFVDADDYVDLNYFEKMLAAIKRNNADAAVSSLVRKKNQKEKTQFLFEEEKIILNKDEVYLTFKIPYHWYVTGKLYKKKILENLCFEEGVCYEDVGFLIRAADRINSLVTVPDIKYYYVSNPESTMKSPSSTAKKLAHIDAMLNAAIYIKKNNLNIKEFPIYKRKILFFSVCSFLDRKDYYLFRLRFFSIRKAFDNNKVFLVFNTACFGDVLLCNSLCQNIKLFYPQSKIIFIVNKPYYEAAKFQKDVDEVVVIDKNKEHKGLLGLIKFIIKFKYKNAFCAFITYKNERNYLIARLSGCKNIVSDNLNDIKDKMQKKHSNLLKDFTGKEIKDLPIICDFPDKITDKFNKIILPENKYIAFSPLTKSITKDIPLETSVELIEKLNRAGYKVIFLGCGEKAEEYSAKLNCSDFINLTGKTTITELGTILLHCKALISADTGTMHLGNALNIPVITVFYRAADIWSPDPKLYKTVTIDKNQTAENIFNTTIKMINK